MLIKDNVIITSPQEAGRPAITLSSLRAEVEGNRVTFSSPPDSGNWRRLAWAYAAGLKYVWYYASFRRGFWWGLNAGIITTTLIHLTV